jgi:hypothetical protein
MKEVIVPADDLVCLGKEKLQEVIRCKDCKWYYRGGATCMFWDGANGMCGDDFCGKAERKEE